MPSFETLSVFPEVQTAYMDTSIMGRARERGIFDFRAHDLRDWTHDRHNTVDDAPFGGGAGMLMNVAFFSPVGETFTQRCAERLSRLERVLFVCGRYEGIDERCYRLADETISLGDFVLTGGELAAMVVIDACVRLLPGALGDSMSAQEESFSAAGLLEYEQYTRPASFRGMDVPEVLTSGDHGRVDAWRRANAIERTARLRPDMLESADITPEERAWAYQVARGAASGTDEIGE